MISVRDPQPIPEIRDALFEQEVLKSPVPVLVMFYKDGWFSADAEVHTEFSLSAMRTVAQAGTVKLFKMNVKKNASPRKFNCRYTPSVHVFRDGNCFGAGMREFQYRQDYVRWADGQSDKFATILTDLALGGLAQQGEAAKGLQRLQAKRQEPPGPRMSTAQIKAKLIETDGLICQGCDRTFDDPRYLEVDHIVPRADGGVDHISNRVLLCRPCNGTKSDRFTLSGLRRENARRGKMAKR